MSELLPGPDIDSQLAAAAYALARGADLESTLDAMLRIVAADTAADAVVLAAMDEDRARIHFVYGLGLLEADIEAVELSTDDLDDPIVAAALSRRVSEGPATGGAAAGEMAARLGLRHLRAMPMLVTHDGIDVAVGVLVIGWTGSEARAGNPVLHEAIANLAAVALDRSRLASTTAERAEWFERLAHLDPLTGLANRRTFDRVLELELARASRQGSEVCVLVFDVDAFREANESAGRAVGDAILRAVAAVLADQVRLVDTVARIGGDEFVIVAPGSGGIVVANRVLNAIRSLNPVSGLPVSVSAGIARFPVDGTSAQAMLDAALAAVASARAEGAGAIAEAAARG